MRNKAWLVLVKSKMHYICYITVTFVWWLVEWLPVLALVLWSHQIFKNVDAIYLLKVELFNQNHLFLCINHSMQRAKPLQTMSMSRHLLQLLCIFNAKNLQKTQTQKRFCFANLVSKVKIFFRFLNLVSKIKNPVLL